MAKRFSDSMKFEDPWYRKLPPLYKIFWEFLLCKCDHAGVWKVDMDRAAWEIGATFDATETLTVFNSRIVVLNSGSAWFIPKFVVFQYGMLNPEVSTHKGVIRVLNYYSISEKTLTVKKGLRKSSRTLQDKDKDKDKVNSNKRMLMLFEELWQQYPRKLGKPDATKSFLKTVKSEEDLRNINLGLKNFLSSRQAKGDPKFIPHGSTWFNRWHDWVTYIEPLNEKEKEDEVRKSIGLSPKYS